MILNDGKYEVDTSTSRLLATSTEIAEGGGYSWETHSVYKLWLSAKGKYFITRDYKEYICMWFLRGGPVKGTVVHVYDNEDEARQAWANYGEVPRSMLVPI